MTTLNHFDVRRRLLNMNTHQPERFGALTVRIFVCRRSTRWEITVPDLVTSFSYKIYPARDYIFGTIDQIGERNAALAKATAYILKNYQVEQEQVA